MSDFFGHENHAYPPSLVKFGSVHSCAKSDLAKCLEELSPSNQSDPPLVEAVILDGVAIVNVFLSYVQQQLKPHVNRIDIVWRVGPNSPIPANWDGFLRVDENKK